MCSPSRSIIQSFLMSWLSLYGFTSNQQGHEQIKVWRGWTKEEQAFVVKQAYEKYYITSDDVKQYLRVSRFNTISNILFPVATFYLYHNLLQKILFTRFYNKTAGGLVGSALVTTAATALWVNLSPVYQHKCKLRVDILEKIYKKLGNSTIRLNDVLPRSWTESQIDRQTRSIYHERNSIFTNYLYPGEDNLRPMLEQSKGRKYSRRYRK